MDWMLFAELAINGGMTGLMYSLVAIGIVLIYKSSSVPNLAQGALTMLGAYVVLAWSGKLGLPMWAAIPLAMVTMFFAGVGIERVALRRLAGRPIIMILMMTLGLDIFLRAGAMTIWGGIARPLSLGIPDDPLFLGPILLNRPVVVGAVVRCCCSASSCCSSAPGWASCCAPSPTTTPRRGRSASRSSAGWR
jgi:branched-chain amino acid transport system permease protein